MEFEQTNGELTFIESFRIETVRTTVDVSVGMKLSEAYMNIKGVTRKDASESVFSRSNCERLSLDYKLNCEDFQNQINVHRSVKEYYYYSFWKSPSSYDDRELLNDKDDDKFLKIDDRLSCAVNLLDDSLKELYVRDSYTEFAEIVLNSYDEWVKQGDSRSPKALVFTGTPGIGKTCFLIYLLCRLRKIGKYKVVLSVGAHQPIIFDEFPKIVGTDDCEIYLHHNKDCFYLYDPQQVREHGPPVTVRGFCVITCSPSLMYYSRIKHHAHLYYMPIWSEEEILKCIKCNVPCKDKDQVRKLYCQWGGSPRCIFGNSDGFFRRLQRMKSNSNIITQLVDCCCNPSLLCESLELFTDCQWLSHMHPESDFTRYTCKWPSEFIKQEIISMIPELYLTLGYQRNLVKYGDFTSVGRLYEYLVLRTLKSRGSTASPPLTVSLYKPNSKDDSTLKDDNTVMLYPKRSVYFMNNDKFEKPEDDVIYIPLEQNKETIDFVKPPWLIQVTTAKSHKFKGLQQIAKNFPNDVNKWKILYIIPTQRKAVFKPPRKAQKKGAYIACVDFSVVDKDDSNGGDKFQEDGDETQEDEDDESQEDEDDESQEEMDL